MGWTVFCIHAPTTAVVEEGKNGRVEGGGTGKRGITGGWTDDESAVVRRIIGRGVTRGTAQGYGKSGLHSDGLRRAVSDRDIGSSGGGTEV